MREIRTLRLMRRGLETWQGRDTATLANRKGRATGKTNLDLHRRASPRPYFSESSARKCRKYICHLFWSTLQEVTPAALRAWAFNLVPAMGRGLSLRAHGAVSNYRLISPSLRFRLRGLSVHWRSIKYGGNSYEKAHSKFDCIAGLLTNVPCSRNSPQYWLRHVVA